MKQRQLVLLILLTLVLTGVNADRFRALWLFDSPLRDPDTETTYKLADQALGATKILFGMGTSVLGLLAFLFSDKVSSYWARSTPAQRGWILAAGVFAAESIGAGMVVVASVMSFSGDRMVRISLPELLKAQGMQVAQLVVALFILTVIAVTANTQAGS